MNTTLQTLVQLQEIDKVILELQKDIKKIPVLLEQLEQLMNEHEQNVTRIQSNIEEQERTRRSKESEIETNLEHIKKYQGQLLQVKTNKEYTALLTEIQGLKSKNSLHEDDILELMESIERAKVALTKAREELSDVQENIRAEKQEKERELQELQQQMAQQEQARENLTSGVSPGILREYTKLLNLRNGIAVSEVKEEGICAGCYVALTPQMLSEVKTGEQIHRCPTCFRFLFWSEPHDL